MDIVNPLWLATVIKKMIVIGGTGRCGTTWLHRWLMEHPDTFGPWGESNLFFTMANYASFNNDYKQDNCFARVRIKKQDYLKRAGEFCFQIFDNPSCNSAYEMKHIRRGNQPFLVERTPANILCFNEIYEMMSPYSDVYLLHIYRDGRNYLESAVRLNWNYMSWEAHADRWIEIMEKMLDDYFCGKTIHVKYEDLIEDPSASRQITKFCEIRHHKDITLFEKPFSQGINHFDSHRWQTLLPNDEIEKCYNKMKPVLKRLGY